MPLACRPVNRVTLYPAANAVTDPAVDVPANCGVTPMSGILNTRMYLARSAQACDLCDFGLRGTQHVVLQGRCVNRAGGESAEVRENVVGTCPYGKSARESAVPPVAVKYSVICVETGRCAPPGPSKDAGEGNTTRIPPLRIVGATSIERCSIAAVSLCDQFPPRQGPDW